MRQAHTWGATCKKNEHDGFESSFVIAAQSIGDKTVTKRDNFHTT
jgi:hypothetical protein